MKVYDLCVSAVDTLQNARGEVSHQLRNAAPQGTVNVSGSNLYLTKFILPLIPDLRERYPKVQIDLTGGDQPMDQRAEAVDLRIRVGDVDASGMKVYPLLPIERVLCVDKALLPVTQISRGPEILPEIPLILRAQEDPEWTYHRKGQVMKHHVTNPVLRVNSYELCVAAVQSGLGAAVLAKTVVQNDIDAENIIELLPNWNIDPIPVSLLVPLSRLRRSEVIAVAQYIARKLRAPEKP